MPPDPLAHLRERFRERCAADLTQIESLQTLMADEYVGRLKVIAHGLSGIAGSFGHREIGTIAATIDNALANSLTLDAKAIDALKGALAKVAVQ